VGSSIVSLAQLHRIDLFSSASMTRILVFRFHVDLEEKSARGKREGFKAGDEKCYVCTRIRDAGVYKRALSTILVSLPEPHLCRGQAGRNLLNAFGNRCKINIKDLRPFWNF
jgi:hypothetical protein